LKKPEFQGGCFVILAPRPPRGMLRFVIPLPASEARNLPPGAKLFARPWCPIKLTWGSGDAFGFAVVAGALEDEQTIKD
jgi:hypothetical protein